MTRYIGFPGTEDDAKRILATNGSTEGTGGNPQSKPPMTEHLGDILVGTLSVLVLIWLVLDRLQLISWGP